VSRAGTGCDRGEAHGSALSGDAYFLHRGSAGELKHRWSVRTNYLGGKCAAAQLALVGEFDGIKNK
jgi:hypothetical protein